MSKLFMRIRYLGVILIFFQFFSFALSTQNENNISLAKIRLPDVINSYQPTIVPVTDFVDSTLFFDRKIHPNNTNGINDNDDIWFSKKNSLGFWNEPQNIGTPLNTKDSDVLFSITPDGQFALVYGVYLPDGSKQNGFSLSRKVNGKFSLPDAIKIKNFYNNSKNFYGFLSADRRILLMSLNREDSYGDLDIYVSVYDMETKTFSEPQNLGPVINTKGSEASVHLALDGKTLYFSSNGHKGFGKLDLFVSRRLDDSWKSWSEPKNLGEDINSQADDGNIWLTAYGNSAYFVSYDTITKREGIYFTELPDSLRPLPYAIVSGKIIKSSTTQSGLFYESVPIVLYYEDSPNVDTVWSDALTGTYLFTLRKGILGSAIIDYKGFSGSFSVATYNLEYPRWFDYDIVLRKFETDPKEAKNLNVTQELTSGKLEKEPLIILYFDLDSDKLTSASKQQLSELLKKYKNIKGLKIVGHTDESGTENYNFRLSKKRADNTANFIKNNKLTKAKLTIEAKGKTSPRSTNHELNRRVEIFQIE